MTTVASTGIYSQNSEVMEWLKGEGGMEMESLMSVFHFSKTWPLQNTQLFLGLAS